MDDRALIDWLFEYGNAIVRHRVALEFLPDTPGIERERLRREAVAAPEVSRWLDNLRQARHVHGSRDTDAENALGKLLDYGLDRGFAPFDAGVQRLLRLPLELWDPLVLTPFLIRAGYADHPLVNDWLETRLEKLHRTAKKGDFEFYLDAAAACTVPKAWRAKPIYRDEFGHAVGYALPTCYDLYAMASVRERPHEAGVAEKLETIAAFLSDDRFQSTVGGYGWDRRKRRCYAAGRVFLACVEPARLVLFLELGAGFAAARRAAWFRNGLAELDHHRTPAGTYRFPPGLLRETTGAHLYAGAHMGLGEHRRSPLALELESTFRMLLIRKRMSAAGSRSVFALRPSRCTMRGCAPPSPAH